MPLIEQISAGDAQMVLELQCRRTSVKSEKFGKFDIPGYNFPFSFWRGKRHERPFISSPPTG